MSISSFLKTPLALTALVALVAACGGGGGDDDVAAGNADGRALGASVGALQPAPSNLSGNVTCRNMSIGTVSLDSVFVPVGAACELRGTRLFGTVSVGRDATLAARDIRANGNLQADGAAHVELGGASTIGGSVQIKQGGTAFVGGATVGGDIQLDAMRGAVVASANRVTGSVHAVANRGGLTITDNRIDGNLQCKENVPAPVVGGNTAASIEDQCVPGESGGGGSGGDVPAPGGSLSGNVTCDGLRIGAESLDTVTVPDNSSCTLQSTRLVGSILVGRNARLDADGVAVNGNVQADGSAHVRLGGPSTVGGSVQIKEGGSASITSARITGDLQIDAMRGPVSAAGNTVGGSLQAVGNRGGVTLNANAMNGNLQCKENQPAPAGGGNTAALKEDQCAAL